MCWLFYVSVLFFTFATSDTKLLEKLSKIKWQCANENCSEPIAEGYSFRLYNANDPLELNFNANDAFLILGKSNDESYNYWLVQAGDKKGIVPVEYVRERGVIINQRNQVVTELDLGSIIQSTKVEKTSKEAIKPSSPQLVVDGTTLPSYDDDDDGLSLDFVVEDDSEEVFISPESQEKENPLFETSSDQDFTKSSTLGPNGNQKSFVSGGAEGLASKNANLVEDLNSGWVKNNTDLETNVTEASKDLANDKNEISQGIALDNVSNLNKASNDQSFIKTINNLDQTITNTNANNTELNQVNNGESSLNNINDTIYNKADKNYVETNDTLNSSSVEDKVDVLKSEKNDPGNEPTNAHNIHTFNTNNEYLTTGPPEQPNEEYSSSIDQPHVFGKENFTPASDLPGGSDEAIPVKENVSVSAPEVGSAIEKTSTVAEASLLTGVETVTPAKNDEQGFTNAEPILSTGSEMKKDETVSQLKTGLGTETFYTTPLPESVASVHETTQETHLGTGNLHAGPFSQSSESLSFVQPFGSSKPSGSELPSTTSQHMPHDNAENLNPVDSSDLQTMTLVPPSSISSSSMPASDTIPKYHSQGVPESYSNAANDYNKNDTGNSESLSNESSLNSEPEESSISTGEFTAGPDPPPVDDQYSLGQSHHEEVVPETLPSEVPIKEDNDGKDNSASYPQLNDEIGSVIEEGDSWFSGISSIMSSFTDMFAKSDIGVERDVPTIVEENVIVIPPEKIESQQCDGEATSCAKESDNSHWKDSSVDDNETKGSIYVSEMFGSFSESQMSLSTLICLIITSVVVLLFSLGYYYLENLKQDTSLVAKINTVSTELFFTQKELASIEEQYQLANENYRKLVSETSHNETAIDELRKELEESKAARGALEDEIKRLEKEIESLVEEGDEMHRMLAESFSEEERTKSLLANISDLKSVLSERLQEIVSLTEQLDKEKQEVELLTISLKKSEEKREATEDKYTKVLIDADSKTLAVTKEFEEKITTLERIIEERSLERTNFEKQICELKGTCELLMVEKELAEKELKKAHGVSSGKALSEWLETKQLRTDLLAVQKEAEKLSQALEEVKNRGALLEEKERQLLNEIEDLNNKYESAEKEKINALTKLQVLSNHFKEKEIELQEELGIKESQWLQKQSEDHTIYEQMRSLREENLSYKAQNDALKKEIIDQEASFKIQIANEEQKAQENWINLRHTERRLKEVQMEAAHLRSRLTALETNPDSLEDKHKSLEMVNGDVSMGAASPPFMLYPPPDYIPPPPLVSPTRPPPLGRLSSPPLTPPAPLSPYEFYPPPPPSPPPPLRVHKPQPREPHRKQKDSQSSNHSSESAEKPIRRGKR